MRNTHDSCVFLATAGSGSVVRRAILDLNCRIGSNVRLVNAVRCCTDPRCHHAHMSEGSSWSCPSGVPAVVQIPRPVDHLAPWPVG